MRNIYLRYSIIHLPRFNRVSGIFIHWCHASLPIYCIAWAHTNKILYNLATLVEWGNSGISEPLCIIWEFLLASRETDSVLKTGVSLTVLDSIWSHLPWLGDSFSDVKEWVEWVNPLNVFSHLSITSHLQSITTSISSFPILHSISISMDIRSVISTYSKSRISHWRSIAWNPVESCWSNEKVPSTISSFIFYSSQKPLFNPR